MPYISKEESLKISERYRFQTMPMPRANGARPIAGTEKPGYSAIYRNNAISTKGPLRRFLHSRLCDLDTSFRHAVNLFGDANCLGYRAFNVSANDGKCAFESKFTYFSFKQVLEQVDQLASGIIHVVSKHPKFTQQLTKNGKPSFTVSLYAENRYEWVVADLAASSVSLASTPLYDTLGSESIKYCLELTEAPLIVLSGSKVDNILTLKENGDLPDLLVLVTLDSLDRKAQERAKELGLQIFEYSALLQMGQKNMLPKNFNPPSPDTVHNICFTSGTTGTPKGVVLTHRNLVSHLTFLLDQRESHSSTFSKGHHDATNNLDDEGEQFRYLSALPLAHIMERGSTLVMILHGVSVGFLSQSMLTLVDDLRCLKPHIISSVPRVWNRIALGVKAIMAQSNSNPERTVSETDKLLIRNKLRKFFGFDKCRDACNGGAPLSLETMSFLSEWLCIGFGQGYGATETSSGIAIVNPFDADAVIASCGPIGASVEVRLRDVPSLGYTHKDEPNPRGELMIRGPQVFQAYYKKPDITAENFDEDGFFHSGDIASIDERGNLYIIDRVKNFFKLAQGEYVTPERIENIYTANSDLIQQIFVHGDSDQSYLVGVVGINPDVFAHFLKSQGMNVSQEEMVKMLSHPKIKKDIVHAINDHVKKSGLQGFEKVHNIHLDVEPLKMEDNVLTPTLKLKREVARIKFRDVLDKLYAEGSVYKNSKM